MQLPKQRFKFRALENSTAFTQTVQRKPDETAEDCRVFQGENFIRLNSYWGARIKFNFQTTSEDRRRVKSRMTKFGALRRFAYLATMRARASGDLVGVLIFHVSEDEVTCGICRTKHMIDHNGDWPSVVIMRTNMTCIWNCLQMHNAKTVPLSPLDSKIWDSYYIHIILRKLLMER